MELNLILMSALSMILFAIGVYGLISKRNMLRLIFSIEIMINAAIINFVTFAAYLGLSMPVAQIAGVIVIALAAAEAAAGLSLILEAHRLRKDVVIDQLREMKG